VFRNEGVSSRHNPEFTSVEIYQAYADYSDMMALTEQLLRTAAQAVCGQLAISYQGVELDLAQPFRRVTMNQLVQDATGGDLLLLLLLQLAGARGADGVCGRTGISDTLGSRAGSCSDV
jgi:lysyl-tRNA synthetase class 2